MKLHLTTITTIYLFMSSQLSSPTVSHCTSPRELRNVCWYYYHQVPVEVLLRWVGGLKVRPYYLGNISFISPLLSSISPERPHRRFALVDQRWLVTLLVTRMTDWARQVSAGLQWQIRNRSGRGR